MAFDLQREFNDFLEAIRRIFSPTAQPGAPRDAHSNRTKSKPGAGARKGKTPGAKTARPQSRKPTSKRGNPRKSHP